MITDNETEKAMVETYQAQYVSLHVRVSNNAALRLYRDTLGFKAEKIEAKYYADGEDAHSMKLDLGFLRDEINEREGIEDEGEAVGDEKADVEALEAQKTKEIAEKLRKVRIGRQIGVGELVEKNESKKA